MTADSAARPVLGFVVDLVLAVMAMLALMLVGGAGWALWRGMQWAWEPGAGGGPQDFVHQLGAPGPTAMLLLTVLSTGGAALLVYRWRRPATSPERSRSRQAAMRPQTWGWAVATGFAIFMVSSLVSALAERAGAAPEPSNAQLIESALSASPLLMVALGVVLAPLYEELLFRRVLFGRLWAAGRPLLGLALSSLAFALMHELPGVGAEPWQATSVLWLLYAAMGAAFAGLYWHTRTLWAPIVAHAVNNALALTVLYFQSMP